MEKDIIDLNVRIVPIKDIISELREDTIYLVGNHTLCFQAFYKDGKFISTYEWSDEAMHRLNKKSKKLDPEDQVDYLWRVMPIQQIGV